MPFNNQIGAYGGYSRSNNWATYGNLKKAYQYGEKVRRMYNEYSRNNARPQPSKLVRRRMYTDAMKNAKPYPPMMGARNKNYRSKPQGANYSKYGGKVLNKFSYVKKGKQSTKSGVLVVGGSKKKKRNHNKNYPHSVFQKITFCDSANFDTTNKLIKYRDYLISTNSVGANCLSLVHVNLAEMNALWANADIGNELIPDSVNLVSQNNATNTAMVNQPTIITHNRIPLSNNTNDSSSTYHTPNHIVSGIDINMNFTNPQMVGQWLTIKLCRLNLPEPQPPTLTARDEYELFNKQTITDSRYFETIYQHSVYMQPNSVLNKGRNRIYKINKKIICDYLKSSTRKTSGYESSDVKLGEMVSPDFKTDNTGNFYNNLHIVISSKCVDDNYIQHQDVTQGLNVAGLINRSTDVAGQITNIATLSGSQDTRVALNAFNSSTGLGTGFARFCYTGEIKLWCKVQNYDRS
jgi:hypothetical protein